VTSSNWSRDKPWKAIIPKKCNWYFPFFNYYNQKRNEWIAWTPIWIIDKGRLNPCGWLTGFWQIIWRMKESFPLCIDQRRAAQQQHTHTHQ
jgi:hypothetical protein